MAIAICRDFPTFRLLKNWNTAFMARHCESSFVICSSRVQDHIQTGNDWPALTVSSISLLNAGRTFRGTCPREQGGSREGGVFAEVDGREDSCGEEV